MSEIPDWSILSESRMIRIGLWSSRVWSAKSGLHPSLQLRPCKRTIQTGDEGVGVAAQRVCMLELVQVPISPRECWSELPHMYNRRMNTTPHTRTHKPADTIGTVSQHLHAARFFFVMDTFRHIACTQTQLKKGISAFTLTHSFSPSEQTKCRGTVM